MHFHEHRRHLTARELRASTGLIPASRRFKGGGGIGGIVGGIVGSVFGPVGSMAGAALGSTLGGVSSGQSFGVALKGGLITGAMSGLTAGIGGGLSGMIGESALGATLGNMGSSALGYGLTGLGTGALGAMMTGQNPLKGALIGGLSSAAGGALNSYVSDQGGLSGIFGSKGDPNTAAIGGSADASGATLGEAGAPAALGANSLGGQTNVADTYAAGGPLAQAAGAPIESTAPISGGDFSGTAAPTPDQLTNGYVDMPTSTDFAPLREIGQTYLPDPTPAVSVRPLESGNTVLVDGRTVTYPMASDTPRVLNVIQSPNSPNTGPIYASSSMGNGQLQPGGSLAQLAPAAANTPAAVASATTDAAKQGILGKIVDSSVPFTQDPIGWVGNNKLLSLGIGGTALSALGGMMSKPASMPTPPQMAGAGGNFTPQNYTWGGVPGVTARTTNPYTGNFATYGQSTNPAGFLFFNPQQLQPVVTAATGGHVAALNMLHGGHSRGPGTGTSDSIPAMLSNGEFVLPTDVVSKLGRGDNDKGAAKLHEVMNHVRKGGALSMMGA